MKTTRAPKALSLLAALLLSAGAGAAPPTAEQREFISNMVAQCAGVMGKDVCRVENDGREQCAGAADVRACRLDFFRRVYRNGISFSSATAGMKFTADEYFEYVFAGDRMCDVIVRNCGDDYDGRGCRLARWLWRQGR